MTICIAAIADRHEAIVSCVDTRISTELTTYDPIVGRKICGMRGWTMLTSGTTCYSESLVDAFQALLSKANDNDPPAVKNMLEDALRSELANYGAAKYLAPYGLNMQTFLASRAAGATVGFSDEIWGELSRLILDYSDNYDAELIVSGWGETQEKFVGTGAQAGAHIFRVSRDGATSHSDDGFYACGSGAVTAHSILAHFNHEPHAPLAHSIYHVAVAKFMAERTGTVGPNTVMRISTRTGQGNWRGYFIQPSEVDDIRAIWSENYALKISPRIEDAMVEIIAKHQKSQVVTEDHTFRKINEAYEQEATRLASQKSEPKQ